ncbi:MAG: hypothetical protein PHV74_05300 [Dehalococcoidia bacterium]|nr:hypothetical protein [Dehalococcoidia bacterium]
MCFSAPSSFIASGALAASGIAIARIPKEKSEIPLSLCPLIFAAHQFIEGILWLNYDGVLPGEYRLAAVYAFVFIAFAFWPIYVPFSAYLMEQGKTRRMFILICQFIGLYVGITFLSSMIHNPIDAHVAHHSFAYQITTPNKFLAPYCIAVTLPFLISSNKRLAVFGLGLTLSCAIAAYMATSTTFPSIWCFFASILSLSLYLYFRYSPKAMGIESQKRGLQLSV